jgi:hypothetical protein
MKKLHLLEHKELTALYFKACKTGQLKIRHRTDTEMEIFTALYPKYYRVVEHKDHPPFHKFHKEYIFKNTKEARKGMQDLVDVAEYKEIQEDNLSAFKYHTRFFSGNVGFGEMLHDGKYVEKFKNAGGNKKVRLSRMDKQRKKEKEIKKKVTASTPMTKIKKKGKKKDGHYVALKEFADDPRAARQMLRKAVKKGTIPTPDGGRWEWLAGSDELEQVKELLT